MVFGMCLSWYPHCDSNAGFYLRWVALYLLWDGGMAKDKVENLGKLWVNGGITLQELAIAFYQNYTAPNIIKIIALSI